MKTATYQDANLEAAKALELRDAARRHSTEYAFQHGRYCGLRLGRVLSEADARRLCSRLPAEHLPAFLRGMEDTAPFHAAVRDASHQVFPGGAV